MKNVILQVAQKDLDVHIKINIVDSDNGNCSHNLTWNGSEYLHNIQHNQTEHDFTGDLGKEFNKTIIHRDKYGIRQFLICHDVNIEDVKELFDWFVKESNISKELEKMFWIRNPNS